MSGSLGYVTSSVGLARNSTLGSNNYDQTATFSPARPCWPLSVELWILFRQFQSFPPQISAIWEAATAGAWQPPIMQLGDAAATFAHIEMSVDGANHLFYPSTFMLTNVLQHVVTVFDGITMKLYFNGALANSSAITGGTNNTFSQFHLFRDDTLSGRSMDGYIASFRAWNSALTDLDIWELYQDPWGMYTSPTEMVTYMDGGTDTFARVTQAVTEVLRSGTPKDRVTQAILEVVGNKTAKARVTQAISEVVKSGTPNDRVTQAVIEVLRSSVGVSYKTDMAF